MNNENKDKIAQSFLQAQQKSDQVLQSHQSILMKYVSELNIKLSPHYSSFMKTVEKIQTNQNNYQNILSDTLKKSKGRFTKKSKKKKETSYKGLKDKYCQKPVNIDFIATKFRRKLNKQKYEIPEKDNGTLLKIETGSLNQKVSDIINKVRKRMSRKQNLKFDTLNSNNAVIQGIMENASKKYKQGEQQYLNTKTTKHNQLETPPAQMSRTLNLTKLLDVPTKQKRRSQQSPSQIINKEEEFIKLLEMQSPQPIKFQTQDISPIRQIKQYDKRTPQTKRNTQRNTNEVNFHNQDYQSPIPKYQRNQFNTNLNEQIKYKQLGQLKENKNSLNIIHSQQLKQYEQREKIQVKKQKYAKKRTSQQQFRIITEKENSIPNNKPSKLPVIIINSPKRESIQNQHSLQQTRESKVPRLFRNNSMSKWKNKLKKLKNDYHSKQINVNDSDENNLKEETVQIIQQTSIHKEKEENVENATDLDFSLTVIEDQLLLEKTTVSINRSNLTFSMITPLKMKKSNLENKYEEKSSINNKLELHNFDKLKNLQIRKQELLKQVDSLTYEIQELESNYC